MDCMQRRHFLARVSGVSATFAGCLGQGSVPAPETTPGTDSPTPPCSDPMVPPQPTLVEPEAGDPVEFGGGRTVTVGFVGLYRSVRTYGVDSPVHLDVATPADAQFVVAEVALGDDGDPVEPSQEPIPVAIEVDGVENPVDRPVIIEEPGWTTAGTLVGFPVPVAPADAAAVVWTGDGGGNDTPRWRLPAGITESLGTAPQFSVEALQTPPWTDRTGEFPVRVTVSNTGDRDGRFLAEFGVAVISDVGETAFEVPAGETVERCLLAATGHVAAGYSSLPVVLDTGSQRIRREVPLRPRETDQTGTASPTPSRTGE